LRAVLDGAVGGFLRLPGVVAVALDAAAGGFLRLPGVFGAKATLRAALDGATGGKLRGVGVPLVAALCFVPMRGVVADFGAAAGNFFGVDAALGL